MIYYFISCIFLNKLLHHYCNNFTPFDGIYSNFFLFFRNIHLQNLIGIGHDASPVDYYKICALYNCRYCMGQRFNLAEKVRAIQAHSFRV